MIGNSAISLSRGNGLWHPGAFLFAAITLLLFAVGYGAMSRSAWSTPARLHLCGQGPGQTRRRRRRFTAMVAYVSFTIGLAAFLGYFRQHHADVDGASLLLAGLRRGRYRVVAVLGYRSIDLSSKILGALMLAEIAVLAVLTSAWCWRKAPRPCRCRRSRRTPCWRRAWRVADDRVHFLHRLRVGGAVR